MPRKLGRSRTKTSYFPLGGGLDVVTPALSIKPGKALAMVNYEPWYNGGYRRVPGFERFDGRPSPSAQTFLAFEVNSAEDITLGDTLTGVTSTATGIVIGIFLNTDRSGNDTVGVTKTTGTFINGENLTAVVTNADEDMRPDANANDVGVILATNDINLINEGVDNATGLVNETNTNDITGNSATWTLDNIDGVATSINAYTLRVRARVVYASPPGSIPSTGPETDDTATYRMQLTVGAEVNSVTFTEADAGAGFVTRTVTQAVSVETIASINAAIVALEQTAFLQSGDLADGLRIEIDSFDVQVDYDSPVAILSLPTLRAAPTQALEDIWIVAAQDNYRADIAVVPGANQVRGAWRRKADSYAIRDNLGVTAGVLHKASSAGWATTGVTMADYIHFTAGLAAGIPVVEGATLTGGTSGATATLHRIVLNGGSNAWDGGGEGYFVLTNIVGGPFQNGEALESPAATPIATANGANVTLAFSAGGRYEFHNHNFFGGSGTFRAYGVNGVDNFAFEIDETGTVSPIFLPSNPFDPLQVVPPGNPFLIREHRNHLFLAYPGGRVVHSIPGEPLTFSGFLGSAEFGLGDELTGMNSIAGNVLVLTSVRETRGLYGTNVLDWEMRLIGEQTGGRLFSTQRIDTVYGLDDLGITKSSRTFAFGDFVSATVSQKVQPIVITQRPRFTASTIVRESNQYRLYFDDNTALIMYVPAGERDKPPEFGFLSYPFPVSQIYNTDDETGKERTYFVTNDVTNLGFVFEDQVGRNFDGAEIISYVRTAFNQLGTPSHKKRFRRADLELNSSKPLDLKFISDLTYGSSTVSSSIEDLTTNDVPVINIFSGGGFWDTDNWDEFFWDGQSIATARAELRGSGENIGFLIFNQSKVTAPFILQGITIHYDLRRLQR